MRRARARDTARRRLATDKHDKVRQEASMAKKLNLCRMDLRALKARRDLDADAVTRSLQDIKNIREETGESLQ